MTDRAPLILHHFDESPFSEKVRLVFGLKKLAWTSALISRIMPRPDLMPMTGGYRRTPTLQIGADIYCDSQCIIRELERRHPTPTLHPNGDEGIGWGSAMWTDRSFFQNTVNLVFGMLADKVPDSFKADREQLRGAKFDVEAMARAIPQMRDQFRAHVGWIDAQLRDDRPWLLGDAAGLADINAYMNVWYATGNSPALGDIVAEFKQAAAWQARVRSIGHGERSEISSADALALCAAAAPLTAVQADPRDPNGRKPGDRVIVTPDDYGRIGVAGDIVSLSAQHIAIRRHDSRAGDIVIHFPRAGFAVTAE